MRFRAKYYPFILLIFLLLSCNVFADDPTQPQDLLPQANEITGWLPDGEPQVAIGQDLYLLINGGAAIYHEYGFKQALYIRYLNADSLAINCEIYEMNSSEAAFGMYSFKKGQDGEPIDLGCAGWRESYYLSFWSGNFLITLIGLSSDMAVLQGMERIAVAISTRLECSANLPQLVDYLPTEHFLADGVVYLRGAIGLRNQYSFNRKDIFAIKEGIVGRYADLTVFLFRYADETEAQRIYSNAWNLLKTSERYNPVDNKHSHFLLLDEQQQLISIYSTKEFIIVIIGQNSNEDSDRIIGTIKKKINQDKVNQ